MHSNTHDATVAAHDAPVRLDLFLLAARTDSAVVWWVRGRRGRQRLRKRRVRLVVCKAEEVPVVVVRHRCTCREICDGHSTAERDEWQRVAKWREEQLARISNVVEEGVGRMVEPL